MGKALAYLGAGMITGAIAALSGMESKNAFKKSYKHFVEDHESGTDSLTDKIINLFVNDKEELEEETD